MFSKKLSCSTATATVLLTLCSIPHSQQTRSTTPALRARHPGRGRSLSSCWRRPRATATPLRQADDQNRERARDRDRSIGLRRALGERVEDESDHQRLYGLASRGRGPGAARHVAQTTGRPARSGTGAIPAAGHRQSPGPAQQHGLRRGRFRRRSAPGLWRGHVRGPAGTTALV